MTDWAKKLKNRYRSDQAWKDDYDLYLNSPEWEKLRGLALARDNHTCQVCETAEERAGLQVHHTSYERVGNEDLEDIVALCSACHQKVHRVKDMERGRVTLLKHWRITVSKEVFSSIRKGKRRALETFWSDWDPRTKPGDHLTILSEENHDRIEALITDTWLQQGIAAFACYGKAVDSPAKSSVWTVPQHVKLVESVRAEEKEEREACVVNAKP